MCIKPKDIFGNCQIHLPHSLFKILFSTRLWFPSNRLIWKQQMRNNMSYSQWRGHIPHNTFITNSYQKSVRIKFFLSEDSHPYQIEKCLIHVCEDVRPEIIICFFCVFVMNFLSHWLLNIRILSWRKWFYQQKSMLMLSGWT